VHQGCLFFKYILLVYTLIMDDSSKRRPAPRQVYVPVHRRKEMEKKENAATPSSLKQLESKPNEDAPVKRKGRGQFKAPSSSDYSQKDSNDMAKINSHVASENKVHLFSKRSEHK
jgi:hypothetical protein